MEQNVISSRLQLLLEEAKTLGMAQAEVSINTEVGFSVNSRLGEVETLVHHQENSCVITVYQGHRRGSASTSDLSESSLLAALQKASAIVAFTEADHAAGLADEELIAKHIPDLGLSYPWSITPTEAIALAIETEAAALHYDSRVNNSEGAEVTTIQSHHYYANSNGFLASYPESSHSISCSVIAEGADGMTRDDDYTIARDPNRLMSPQMLGRKVAEKTLKRLGARKISTRQCPVIFEATVAKSLLKNFIAAISGSRIYRHTSFLCNQLGQKIFPEFITIAQNPLIIGGMGSAPFDDEGVATKAMDYVADGILESYVLSSYSARKLGLTSTGNAGGVFNLSINHSNQSLETLLQLMDTGLLVTELIGQGVNIMTGDYSRGVFGFWVADGKIQYPVHEITIAGNLRSMFQDVVAIGNDVDQRGNIQTGSIFLKNMMIAGE